MKTKLFTVLAAATTFAGVLATTGSANAVSLTRDAFLDYEVTNSKLSDDYVSRPLTIEKFDSSLGELNSVKIDFISNLKGDASFTNTGSNNTKVGFTLKGDLNLGLDNQNLFELKSEKDYIFEAPVYTPQKSINQTLGPIEVKDTKFVNDSNSLQSFIGTGNLNFLFTAISGSTIAAGGNLDASLTTKANALVKVTYDYTAKSPTAIPEPSALIGVGLVAGFGLLSKRNRSFSKA